MKTEKNKECFNETLNEKIRNKITPLANVIELIEYYDNANTEEEKIKAMNLISSCKNYLINMFWFLLKIE